MYEEVGPEEDNVYSILSQESSELLHILGSQSPDVIMQLTKMMPCEAGRNIDHMVTSASASALTEHIRAMLMYYRSAPAAECCSFFQSMCLLCENIPMHLESRLMSVAGYANGEWRIVLLMMTHDDT